MRVVLLSWLAVSTVYAYDAVLFSDEQKLTQKTPSVDTIISSASAESPVVFLIYPDFTLGQFSRNVAAFSADQKLSGLAATVKSSNTHATRYLEDPIYAANAQKISSADDFKSGQSLYVVSGEDWRSMQETAQKVLSQLGAKYTAIITSTDAVSQEEKTRVKRVATDEMEGLPPQRDAATAGPDMPMPLSIPPYNRSSSVTPGTNAALGSCMLYMEGVNIVVQSKTSKGVTGFSNIPVRSSNGTTWSYTDGDVQCVNGTVGNYTFTVNMKTAVDIHGMYSNKDAVMLPSGSVISFTLVLSGDIFGYWGLVSASMNALTVKPSGDAGLLSGPANVKAGTGAKSVNFVGMNSVQGFGFGCSDSQAIFFTTDNDNVQIGISFYNTQVQPLGVIWKTTGTSPKTFTSFSLQVDDCVGTFSPGSWMSIISILILLAGFIFGYLMLNAVQTMDRFDDPKQRQILINVRE